MTTASERLAELRAERQRLSDELYRVICEMSGLAPSNNGREMSLKGVAAIDQMTLTVTIPLNEGEASQVLTHEINADRYRQHLEREVYLKGVLAG